MQKNILIGVAGVVIVIIVAYFLLGGDLVSPPVNGGNGGEPGVLSDVVEQYVYATAELNLAKIKPLVTPNVYAVLEPDIELLQMSGTQVEVLSFSITNENMAGDTGTVSYFVSRRITENDETTQASHDLVVSLMKIDGTWKVSSIPH